MPTPAMVYAAPACALTVVEMTGGVLAAAPAGRMLTVYAPTGSFW